MKLGQVVLLVYAIVMLVGGLAGARAGSKVSLVAGSASSLVLLLALFWSLWNPVAGFGIGAGIGLLLCAVFGGRLARTRQAMPAGLLLALSFVATILLAFAAGRAGRTQAEPPLDVMPAVATLAGIRADAQDEGLRRFESTQPTVRGR